MTSNAADLALVRNVVLASTAVAWVLLLAAPMPGDCAGMGYAQFLAMNSPAGLATGWTAMLLAMMLPVLILPIAYIRRSSFASRRARSTALFLVGYFALWVAVGPILIVLAAVLRSLAAQPWLPAMVVLAMALVWQSSPWKQRCLNRCHNHSGLAAFGYEADLSAVRFGLLHGLWCAGSCWLWMLLPLLLPQGHLFAMALISVLVFAERIEVPVAPRWQLRGLGRVTRIALARARHATSAARA